MPKNSSPNRRMILTVGIILAVACVGLFMINVDPASADRTSLADLTGGQNGATDVTGTVPASDSSMLSAVVKMISALVVVILAVYAGLYLLRKLMGKRYGQGGRGDVLDVLQTTYIGPHKTISLVRVANRSVLVGVTDSQISTLTELDEAETAEIMADAKTSEPVDRFAGMLKTAGDKLRRVGLKKNETALET